MVGLIDRRVLRTMVGPAFLTWMLLFVPSFVVAVVVLEEVSVPVWVVFVCGTLFSEVSRRAVECFTDRAIEGGSVE